MALLTDLDVPGQGRAWRSRRPPLSSGLTSVTSCGTRTSGTSSLLSASLITCDDRSRLRGIRQAALLRGRRSTLCRNAASAACPEVPRIRPELSSRVTLTALAGVLTHPFGLEVIGAAIFIAAVLLLIFYKAFTRAVSVTLASAQRQIHSERN